MRSLRPMLRRLGVRVPVAFVVLLCRPLGRSRVWSGPSRSLAMPPSVHGRGSVLIACHDGTPRDDDKRDTILLRMPGERIVAPLGWAPASLASVAAGSTLAGAGGWCFETAHAFEGAICALAFPSQLSAVSVGSGHSVAFYHAEVLKHLCHGACELCLFATSCHSARSDRLFPFVNKTQVDSLTFQCTCRPNDPSCCRSAVLCCRGSSSTHHAAAQNCPP